MSENIKIFEDAAVYTLCLADGQSWEFAADSEARSWLQKLAVITEIENARKTNPIRLTFVRKDINPAEISAGNSGKTADNKIRNFWFVRFHYEEIDSNIICELCYDKTKNKHSYIISMRQALFPVYQKTLSLGGLPLHAALFEINGKAVAVAGPSGAGKSTCSQRIPSPWRVLGDEEQLVVRVSDESYQTHPFPTWSRYIRHESERTWDIQYHVPLIGLFFLIKSERDAVEPLGQGDAAVMIYKSAWQILRERSPSLDAEKLQKLRSEIFENACHISRSIPSFLLRAGLNGKFWENIEDVLDLKW